MNKAMAPQPRKRPPLRRLLATALSGGLGVFAIAVDTTPIATAAAPAQQSSVTPTDQLNG
jgi:hypothetical protein